MSFHHKFMQHLPVLWPWASCQIRRIAVCACAGNDGNVSPPPQVNDPDKHHGTCVTHVPWCMQGSLTSGFLCSLWWGKRSRHSRRMRYPQFYVSGKRPMTPNIHITERRTIVNMSLSRHMNVSAYTVSIYLFIPAIEGYFNCDLYA